MEDELRVEKGEGEGEGKGEMWGGKGKGGDVGREKERGKDLPGVQASAEKVGGKMGRGKSGGAGDWI